MSVKEKTVSPVDRQMLQVLIECAINDDSKTAEQTINKIVKHKITKRIAQITKNINK